ncbi:MAG: TerC family protein, partial [Pseudomonadota bacterium]
AAREHPVILVFGLILSIALMGVAATYIARLLHKHRWIGYVGLAVVVYVALSMIWEGHRNAVVKLDATPSYNALMPDPLDIGPEEAAEHRLH